MVFSRSDRAKIFAVIILQILFGFLDLLGVALIGILGALAVTGVGSGVKGDRVNTVLSVLNLSESSLQVQVAFLGAFAALVLIGRTIFSVIFTKRILHFLSNRGAQLSSDLVRKILNSPLLEVQSKTSQQIVFSITSGVNAITLGVIGVSVNLISDVSLLLVLGLGLFVVNPVLAFSTFLIFASIAFVLYRISHVNAQRMGEQSANLNIRSNEQMLEVLESYRELFVKDRRAHYSESISDIRFKLANISAELSFMPYVSKYVIESSMVIGAICIAAIQFKMQDAVHAVATLSIFLAAGTRIVPAILRVQQGALSIKSSLGAADPTLSFIDELKKTDFVDSNSKEPIFVHQEFMAEVQVKSISFSYPSKEFNAISNMSLEIKPGQMVALVGPSGGGKTTFIDLILGILSPSSGEIRISGVSPKGAIKRWPGAIAYVPQNVSIANGDIRSNIEMGYLKSGSNIPHIERALSAAHLDQLVLKSSLGVELPVGERGGKLSGGERQRLGIARALFTNPALLVLDEATSALDAETERLVSDSIGQLRGSTTILMVAHRLSTVKSADIVVYIDNGTIVASGSFDEVRSQVKDFDNQASLMGI
jgi:ABC-type multidrug transport system fused ATPase/permease subunit